MSTHDTEDPLVAEQLADGDLWLLDPRESGRRTHWLMTDSPVELSEWV